MELKCGACEKKGKYFVGRVVYDPSREDESEAGMDEGFGFTRYIRCKKCGAGGPWQLTTTSKLQLMALTMKAIGSPEDSQLSLGQMHLFDGTVTRYPTQAEAHLKGLIEKTPDDYFLWSRLGNVYHGGEVDDLAEKAYQEAVRLNEHDVESLHSLGEIALERGQHEEAARYFHEMLRHARLAPARTPPDLLRDLVRDTLERLVELHENSDRRIPLFPPGPMPMPGQDPPKPENLVVTNVRFDTSREEDWERMVESFVTGKLPRQSTSQLAAPRPRPLALPQPLRQAPANPPRVGRNDPCPCGSGKKFKNCCLRR